MSVGVTVRDPLYGMITIPPLCALFLDTENFERLRNIRQLGLCFYVFPSATHTRFEHCLGTCHLASLVCDQLKAHMSPREQELVCLAAMWHDVGHMAFSHLMDTYLEEFVTEEKLVHHEARSVEALIQSNKALEYPLSASEVVTVSKMIMGDTSNERKVFLFQIVANNKSGVDVDRLDYLQRDAYHIGHAGFQPDYILKCLTIKDNELAFYAKAEEELLNMFQTRRRLFRIIYHHKTTRKIESMTAEALKASGVAPRAFLEEWAAWDDYAIICHLRAQCPDYFKALAKRGFGKMPEQKRTPDKDVSTYMDNLVLIPKDRKVSSVAK
jgi:HD superfamily phosphohydrolase